MRGLDGLSWLTCKRRVGDRDRVTRRAGAEQLRQRRIPLAVIGSAAAGIASPIATASAASSGTSDLDAA